MAKEQEKPAEQQQEQQEQQTPPASTSPNEDLFMGNMGKKYPDKSREEIFGLAMSDYDADHEYVKRSQAEAQDLSDILAANDDLNNMFQEIFNRGKDGHPELALVHLKPLMKKYISGELSSEAYLAAVQEEEAAAAAKTKLGQMQEEAFQEECQARGWDVEETLQKLSDIFQKECKTKEDCRAQVQEYFKIIDYDPAVEAAEVRGRNAKIAREQREHTPENPAPSASAPAPHTQRKSGMTFSEMAERAKKARENVY